MLPTTREVPRIPLSGLLLALILGALLLGPAVARGDSLARGAAPAQYRGPSSEVPTRGLPLLESGSLGGGEASRVPEGWARWEFWFEYEKDSLLREAMARRTVTRDGNSGDSPKGPVVSPPSDNDLRDRVLPALRVALRDPDPSVRAAAAMAIGNAGDRLSVPVLAEGLRGGAVGDRRAAVLALGFLHDGDAVAPLLRAFSQDVDFDVRGLAALALGLTGDASAAAPLREALARSLEAPGRGNREMRVAIVSALGLLRDRESVPVLQRALQAAEARDDRFRAHVATALGRIGDPAAAPPLHRALLSDSDAGVRRSAALALGSFRDAAASAALARAMDDDGDVLVRGLAAISLARSAGAKSVKTLVPYLDGKHDRSLRGFAAVALGLTGDLGGAAPALRKVLEGRSEDSLRSAAAVGLGILGDAASASRLWDLARDTASSPDLKGYAILGAAMTGDPNVATLVKETLVSDAPREVLRGAALAAGVRPFPGSSGILARMSLESRDPMVRGAALLGLGLAPDRGAVPLLADIASGRSGTGPLERLEASVALGQMALGGALPPVARVAAGVNWRDLTTALDRATRVF